MNLSEIIKNLVPFIHEKEWFEFKGNWYEPEQLGEYISALSNAAKYVGEEYGYFVWGINDKTHEFVDTKFNYEQNYQNES